MSPMFRLILRFTLDLLLYMLIIYWSSCCSCQSWGTGRSVTALQHWNQSSIWVVSFLW